METPHNDETHRNDDLYNDPEPCIQPKLLQTLTINLIPSNTSHTAVKQPLTYSTWEWSGGNDFAPIDLRASSPPLGSVSSEYRAIDRTIEKFRAFMNFVAKTECKADHKAEREHSARDFRHGLDWREEQLLKAEIRLEVNRPYRFMTPWPLELREQCVKHRALLDRYYRVEGRVGARVKERMEYYKRIEKIKEVNEQMRSEIAMLNEVREAREKDEQEGNDFVVLGIVLDEVEAKLNKNIEQLADGMNMDDGEAQEILTDLPKYISATIFSGDHPELAMRFGHLVQRERDLFPSRFERSTRKKVIRFNVGEEPSFDRKRASPSKQNGSTKKMKGGGSSDRKHASKQYLLPWMMRRTVLTGGTRQYQ
jgi:hypothetical protein